MKKIIFMPAALIFFILACSTTQYNPACLRECGKSNRECNGTCQGLRIPLSEGEHRDRFHYGAGRAFDECSARCERIYRQCKKRCEKVFTVDAPDGSGKQVR